MLTRSAYCCGILACVALFGAPLAFPVTASEPTINPQVLTKSALKQLLLTIAIEANDQDKPAVPAFDSRHLPTWYTQYKGPSIPNSLTITTDPALVDHKWNDNQKGLLLASGKLVQDEWHVGQISYP